MKQIIKDFGVYAALFAGVLYLGVVAIAAEINKPSDELTRLQIRKTQLEVEKLEIVLKVYKNQESVIGYE